ncbi:hypothetical protein B0J17DRAFT_719644 [Rhizoctonia solani]|nr:hypothetical protein B0J17DRAFT_719644 [Rhizoctonia solani]
MVQVLEIPELLRLICEQARRSDLARLLTTSRLFFNCAAPPVWKCLPESAPMILVRLLPDADTYLKNSFDVTVARSLQSLDTQSLARFNLYVPYIKQIARHARNRQSNVIWDRLLKLVGTHPVLPKLEVLKLSLSIPGYVGIRDPVSYISAYLCPSLVEIDHTRKTTTFMEPQDLSDFVSIIEQHCPHIRTLKLNNVTHVIRLIHNTDQLANSLARLRNLRVLGLGSVALDPKVLIALSSLPNLESLFLTEAFDNWKSDRILKPAHVSLPYGSFPSLRHLGINPCFDPEAVTQIWSLNAVVQRLTSVSVYINTSFTLPQLRRFLQTICQSSPLITALSLDCADSLDVTSLFPELVDTLAQLPLQCLWLSGKDHYHDSLCWDTEKFALAFPKMEHLRIRGYYFTFKDLMFIAKHMPQLQQLLMRVRLTTDWPSRDKILSLDLTPSPSPLYFHIQNASFTPSLGMALEIRDGIPKEDVEVIAAGLHALWPKGVTCGDYRRPDKSGAPSYTEGINTALKRLREIDQFNDRKEVAPLKYTRKCVSPWFGRF